MDYVGFVGRAGGPADDLQLAGLQLGNFEPGELRVDGSGLRLRDALGVRCASLGRVLRLRDPSGLDHLDILRARNILFGLRVASPVTSANLACSSFSFILRHFAISFFVLIWSPLLVRPARARHASGFVSVRPCKLPEDGQVDGARVAA